MSGEETVGQVRERAQRLAVDADRVEVVADARLSAAVAAIELHRPAVCAIDSVQTLVADHLDAPAGSVAQVRECAATLLRVAKASGVALILVGQVTKDGGLAGPRTLEHLVDVVVYFEGDETRAERVLRPTKNRFGSTDEAGILEMRPDGLAAGRPDAPSDEPGRASRGCLRVPRRARARACSRSRCRRSWRRPRSFRHAASRSGSTVGASRRSSPCSRGMPGYASATRMSS